MEEGENVLCTVKEISETAVFVTLENGKEGTIVISEIAPGRIRNLRDYVVPGKKIACKILRIDNNITLSLRRVSEKEKREVMEKYEKEKNSLSILKSVAGEKAGEIAKEIKKTSSLNEFLQNCKSNPSQLEKFFSKEDAEKLCKILQEKKEKLVEIRKEFVLKSDMPNGVNIIKKTLLLYKEKILYLAAGRFVIKSIANDYKKANQEIQRIIQDIEIQAKKEKLDFEVREK